jgi:hypothetical protein
LDEGKSNEKHALTKLNCFKWVPFGMYVDIKRKGCHATLQATKKVKKMKRKEKNTNNDEEDETSKDDEDFDDDIYGEIIEEPLTKITRSDPTKKQETVSVSSMYDSKDYLKHLSSANLKNS